MKKKILTILISIVFLLSMNKFLISAPICSTKQEETLTRKIENNNQKKNNSSNNDEEENQIINEEEKSDEIEEQTEIEISADEKIEVDKEKGVMIATGNAFVKEGITSLSADMLTAFSCQTIDGETQIIQINADQNVIIKSDQGNAYANRGVYFVEKKIIELYDNVKLEKDGDILVGDTGKFNVYTGKGEISVLPSSNGVRKKVYGIIKSKKK